MTDTNEELPPDWAIEEALKLSMSLVGVSGIKSGECLASTRRYILAHARTIAKHEQPPVDPDVRLVADVINAFECSAWVTGDTAMRELYAADLARAVAVYRERKQ